MELIVSNVVLNKDDGEPTNPKDVVRDRVATRDEVDQGYLVLAKVTRYLSQIGLTVVRARLDFSGKRKGVLSPVIRTSLAMGEEVGEMEGLSCEPIS